MARVKKQRIEIAPGESRHHVFWEEDFYKGRIKKRFREHCGLIIPVPLAHTHRKLHKAIAVPPPQPYRDDMIDCTDFLDAHRPDELGADIVWGIRLATHFFRDLAMSATDESFRTRQQQTIADHLARQLHYITMSALAAELSGAHRPRPLADQAIHERSGHVFHLVSALNSSQSQ